MTTDTDTFDTAKGLATALAALIERATKDADATNSNLREKGVPEKAIKKNGKLDWKHMDTAIEHAGTKITLPADPESMPIPEAIVALQRKQKDEETVLDVHEMVDAHPLDGAVAFVQALRLRYGWANSVPTPGFFGPTPPKMLTVDVGPGPEDKIQVPWGGFQIPGVDSPVHTTTTKGPNGLCFVFYGKVKKKEADILKLLGDLTRAIVKENSIYRGKALRLRNIGEELDVSNPPTFIRTDAVNANELVMQDEVRDLIAANIWTLIEHTDACRKAKIPLKRGVLLESTYGTGKSLTGLVTAQKCVDNGWTYITIDRVQSLKATLEFAKRYEPCVIFAEDIDRAAGSRNEATNDLLNILDGVLSKDNQIMVVLTTNHIDRIDQSMLRPGRLDAVISVLPPDAKAVGQLITIYGRDLLAPGTTFHRVGKEMAGQIPATIREVVERAKLGAIARQDATITEDDLLIAAKGMQHHLRLLNRPRGHVPNAEEQVGLAIARLLREQVGLITARGLAAALLVDDTSNPGLISETDEAAIETVTRDLLARLPAPIKNEEKANG